MQAITTKFLGCTNTRGARIKATCQAGTVMVPYGYSGVEEEHKKAVVALLFKLDWQGSWVGGGLPDGTGNAYVCVAPNAGRHVS